MIYDISRTLSPTLAVWPGDTPFSVRQQMSLAAGDSANLTAISMTPHAGTHLDAPWHVLPDPVYPADLPLEPFFGPARVVTVARQRGGITPDDLVGLTSGGLPLDGAHRLLLHTWYSDVPDDRFETDFPYPSAGLVDWLADRGVRLLGVDVPSVDGYEVAPLDAHHRLFARGMFNLENLMLRGVPDGDYELVALPLKMAGVCGSPVRAILRTLA
jgi:arylformamidase